MKTTHEQFSLNRRVSDQIPFNPAKLRSDGHSPSDVFPRALFRLTIPVLGLLRGGQVEIEVTAAV